jgi:hypothetical protein
MHVLASSENDWESARPGQDIVAELSGSHHLRWRPHAGSARGRLAEKGA